MNIPVKKSKNQVIVKNIKVCVKIKKLSQKRCFFEQKRKKNKNKELNILKDVITIINQYFQELIEKFEGLTDIRKQSYVKYKMKVIFMVRLLALMCEIKTMHEMTREFNTQEAIEISQILTKELVSTITNLKVLKKVQLRFD